jgi:outer membrane protein OmpA-like peptidoglycan-associated protein
MGFVMIDVRRKWLAIGILAVATVSLTLLPQSASAANYPPVPPQVEVPVGQSALEVDGAKVPVVVVPTPQDNGLVVTGPGFTMQLQGQTGGGTTLPLAPDGSLLLNQSGQAAVGGTGFQPQSEVGVYMFSTPYFLGTTTVTSDGKFAADFPLPPGIDAGKHTVQATGYSLDGAVRVLNVAVTVLPTKSLKESTVVLFDVLSSAVTPAGEADLKALVKSVPKAALDVNVSVVGYVQPTSRVANDESLSLSRARNTAAELKSLGLKGAYKVRGNGQAKQTGAVARRVVVTVSYATV